MRHGQRHLPYAVSTVVGLAAPALAALLLTSSTPGLAAVPAPTPAVDPDQAQHAMTVSPAAPVTTPAAVPSSAPTSTSAVVHTAAPQAATLPVTHAAAPHVARPATAPARRTAPAPARPTRRPAPSQTAQPAGSDDYPYRTQSDFYAVDRWGFTERQCVSFAAWRLAQHGHTISNNDNWGSALTWDSTARRLGFTVTSTPRVGAVAQWHANESSAYYGPGAAAPNGQFTAGDYGHVGWVKQVYADGSVLIEQYNVSGDRAYSVMRVKAPRYIVL